MCNEENREFTEEAKERLARGVLSEEPVQAPDQKTGGSY